MIQILLDIPIVVPVSHDIVWDEQGEVIPGISMTVATHNLTWLKSIVENYGEEFFEKFAIFYIWVLADARGRTPYHP